MLRTYGRKHQRAHLDVSDASAGERQHVDDGLAAHVHGVAALLVVHADVVLRLMEVEAGGP